MTQSPFFVAVLVFFYLLPVSRTAAQQVCAPLTNATPSIDSLPYAEVERYLARSIYMGQLADQNTSRPHHWDTIDMDSCSYTYCPKRYAENIQMLAKLNASFITGAAGRWGEELTLSTEPHNSSNYRAAAQQVVVDINRAYDCAGLRHPIIQASILENISIAFTQDSTVTSAINDIHIPASIIRDFENEMTPEEKAYYFIAPQAGSTPQARQDLRFKFNNAAWLFWDRKGLQEDWYSPDYEKIEGRMWMYYQATLFIDMGYTALHVGQPRVWGKLAKYASANQQQDVVRMLGLVSEGMNKIRAYAKRRGSFVLLMAESAGHYNEYGFVGARNYYSDFTNRTLLFDFKQVPMRPMEISSAEQIAADRGSCTSPSSAWNKPGMFNNTPCAGQLNASIDKCNGPNVETSNYFSDGGGRSSFGIDYTDSESPYQIAFDFSSGYVGNAPGENYPGRNGTWGYDDAHWFSSQLDASCKAYWLNFQLAAVRKLTESKSFLTIPGWLPGRAVKAADFHLVDEPEVLDVITRAWEVSAPSLAIDTTNRKGKRAGSIFSMRIREALKRYPKITMSVTNPDVTSIYTWQVQLPDGSWHYFKRGETLQYLPTKPGKYLIRLRQDNLGLPASTSGFRNLDNYLTISAT